MRTRKRVKEFGEVFTPPELVAEMLNKLPQEIKMKFDVIVGNPPYQSPDSRRDGAIWPEFIASSFLLLKQNGWMVMLSPVSWSASDNRKQLDINLNTITVSCLRYNIFDKMNLNYIKFGKNVNKYFNVDVDIGYFIANKTLKEKTMLDTDLGIIKINLNNYPFIPYYNNNIIDSILFKTIFSDLQKYDVVSGDYRLRIKNSKLTCIKNSDEYKYPFVTTSSKYNKKIYGYSNFIHKYQLNKKVIWSDSGYNIPFFDDGKFGLGDHSFAILVDHQEEANKIIWYLKNSKLLKFLQLLRKVGGYVIGFATIQNYLPKINIKNLIDEELYKYFKLTQEEIDLIENEN